MAQEEKPTITPAAPATPPAPEPTTQTVKDSMPAHLAGVEMKDTFLPEAGDEEPAAPETPVVPATPTVTPPADGKDITVPTTPATPAVPTPPVEQPKTAQNEEIVDKTVVTPPVDRVYAGKYKTVEDLKHGIEELGGDPTGIDDPTALEQGYLAAQKIYNRMTERNKEAEKITTPKEEPKKWALDDATIDAMMKEIDYDTIENSTDLVKQTFQIMFKHLAEQLPNMIPPAPEAAPQMSAQEMAAMVKSAETANDALGFIEAKVPRLISDSNFRLQFANHLSAGKKAGTYPTDPGKLTRDVMVTAMKDFLAGAAAIAAEAKSLEATAVEDKSAAGTPDGGGTPATTTPPADPQADILDSIVGAKATQDQRMNFA